NKHQSTQSLTNSSDDLGNTEERNNPRIETSVTEINELNDCSLDNQFRERKEIIIVKDNISKIKTFLEQEGVSYEIYQKAQGVDIFANYSKAIKNKEREKELKLWDNVDLDEELNSDDETEKFLDFEVPVVINNKEGLAMLDQIKTVDKSRLIRKLGKLTEMEMLAIREKLDLVFD
ncbi:11915_t:CDS:2, partial [Racocetra fulgida]